MLFLLLLYFESAGLSPTPVADPPLGAQCLWNKTLWLLYWVTLLAQFLSFPAAEKDEMPTAQWGLLLSLLAMEGDAEAMLSAVASVKGEQQKNCMSSGLCTVIEALNMSAAYSATVQGCLGCDCAVLGVKQGAGMLW